MYHYIFIAILFLLLASFLNVVIYRLPRGESLIYPGSHCTSCGHSLYPLDLLPIFSYLLLRGKCRYCQARIPAQYLLVEIITPLLWILVFMKWGFSMLTISGLLLTAVLVVAAFIDINEGIVPDALNLSGLIMALGLSFFTIGIRASLVGAVGFALIFFIIALLSRGGMGGGDIKLAALIGAFTGFPGALLVILISSWLGGLWAIALLLRGGAGLKTAIKFAPFLAIAAWLVWMYQIDLITFYLNRFWGIMQVPAIMAV